MILAFCIVCAFVCGWACGHNWLFVRTCDDVAIMAQLRSNARWLDETKRFVGPGFRPRFTATYTVGEAEYELSMVRRSEANAVVIDHDATRRAEEE